MTAWQRVEPMIGDDHFGDATKMVTDYIEPWQPRVGQRVRVRLSGECVFDPLAESINGHVATVALISRESEPGQRGYPYRLAEYGMWWCAAELEPISIYSTTRTTGSAPSRTVTCSSRPP